MFSLVKMWFLVFSGRNLSHHRQGQFCETLRFLSRPSNCFFLLLTKKTKKKTNSSLSVISPHSVAHVPGLWPVKHKWRESEFHVSG